MATQAKSPKVHAENLHFEHVLWLNQLSFYKQELGLFQKRLEQVTTHNNTADFLRELSHVQNQLTIQQEQTDIHLHTIKESEQELEKMLITNVIRYEHGLFEDHPKERQQMEVFIRIYEDFKNELNRFLIKWM